jgi:hypothetical protein
MYLQVKQDRENRSRKCDKPVNQPKPQKMETKPQNVPPNDETASKEVDKSFNFVNVCFKEMDNGKTRCGICQTE